MKDERKRCFVIMPFTVKEFDQHKYRDQNHWNEVYEGLIIPAVTDANLLGERDDKDYGSRLIIENVLEKIEKADVILCDLSSHNPNVFLELGWALRTDKPYILIKDDLTSYNFDLNQHYTFNYTHTLQPTILKEETKSLTNAINETLSDKVKRYSLVKHLAISFSAIEAIKEGSVDTELLKEIQHSIRDIQTTSRFSISQNYRFPWPTLLKKANYTLQEIIEFVSNLTDKVDLTGALDEKLMEMGMKHNHEVQVSILAEDRNFVYHDWGNMINTYAAYKGSDGFDIYEEIKKYPSGAVAWIDRSSNLPKEISATYKRLNIALFTKLNDWKIIVETHFEADGF